MADKCLIRVENLLKKSSIAGTKKYQNKLNYKKK